MCQYCEGGEKTLYQQTAYGKLYIERFACSTVLMFKPTICPPYSTCSARNVDHLQAYKIKYCPECGRKL